MTHNADNAPARGTVFFDADCSLCRRLVARHGSIFERRGFLFEPLQRAIRSGLHPIPAAEFQREMKLLTADRRWLGGADAWLELWASVGWMRPLAMLGRLPGLHALAVWIYGHIAANRHCLDGACRLRPRPAWDRWLPLILMPVLVLVFFRHIEPRLFAWMVLILPVGCLFPRPFVQQVILPMLSAIAVQ
jgi:predicted DCC family thiol-disulfide oxidoreductase YuxK